MKIFIVLSLLLTATSFANGDLSIAWKKLIEGAKQDSKIVSSSSHTGSHKGVYIMTPSQLKFMISGKGDPALTFHQAAAKKFASWAKTHEASTSTSSLTGGETTLRIKAKNGDSISLLYRPPTLKGADGTFTVIFVDASSFSS